MSTTIPSTAITQILADYVVHAKPQDLPADVRKAATCTFLNWTGCAVGSAHHETLDVAIAALAPFSGPGVASVLGRKERLDPLHAALMNGISSHVFDFDDTHLRTVIHPAGPVASALLAYAEYKPVNGIDFINALALGIEVECRIGNAVYPEHYDVGWHITGTTGVFGAAAAIGKLLGLDTQRMTWALGLAATQPVGLREMFGTMTKSFHPGRAAQNGFTAALLAEKGYTSSDQGIEAKRGWANVLSTKHDYAEITDGLGSRYELLTNSYKPFACGIVIHPAIDGCIQLRNAHGLKPEDVRSVELRVHYLVLELTGKKTPRTGLEGKFSVYHAAAMALLEGAGGEPQFSDQAVIDPNVIALRDRITAIVDDKIAPDEVRIMLTLNNGKVIEQHVLHAIGSIARPMTERDLEAKFRGLVDGILGTKRSKELLDICWQLETLSDASKIAEAGRL
ncbi:MAG: MmgE/PrpD family protein [Acidocella sp.]|nr:MmgE/PrpD family protein [Acidocella sp.]